MAVKYKEGDIFAVELKSGKFAINIIISDSFRRELLSFDFDSLFLEFTELEVR